MVNELSSRGDKFGTVISMYNFIEMSFIDRISEAIGTKQEQTRWDQREKATQHNNK